MRSACVLVFTIACSTNHTTTQSDRPKTTQPTVMADAMPTATGSVDAMSEGPTEQEIDDALQSLSSEHGAQDIRNIEWWQKNGKYVRARLRVMLEDGQDNIQSDNWAIRILGDIGDAADVALLANILNTHKRDTARTAAATALGKISSPEATTALIAATHHEKINTAGYATDGLGMRKDDAARARIVELVNHKDSTLRFHAVNALAEMGGSKDVLAARKKIEKDAEVRAAIDKALKAQ